MITATNNLTDQMLIGVRFKICFSVHEVILREVTLCVCRCSMADPHAPGYCTKPLFSQPCTDGRFTFFFSSKLLCTDVMFLHWNKANCCHQVLYFECLCSERVLECMLLRAIKVFSPVKFPLYM